jgi:hypothetical protein
MLPSPKSQDHFVGLFNEESMNWTVRGSYPTVIFEVNCATGVDPLALVMLESAAFPERLVPVSTVLCAGCARDGWSGSAVFVTWFDPDFSVIAGNATYFSGRILLSHF